MANGEPRKFVLKWRGSYETLKFDTEDGDLSPGQYAREIALNRIYYRPENSPKHRDNFSKVCLEEESFDTTGKEEVQIIGKTYYDTFWLPNGKKLRVPCEGGKAAYFDRSGGHPEREITRREKTIFEKD